MRVGISSLVHAITKNTGYYLNRKRQNYEIHIILWGKNSDDTACLKNALHFLVA